MKIKEKIKPKIKKKFKITGLNITKKIEMLDDSIQNNIPYSIKYQDVIYIRGGSNHENKKRMTWYAKIIEKLKINLIYKEIL